MFMKLKLYSAHPIMFSYNFRGFYEMEYWMNALLVKNPMGGKNKNKNYGKDSVLYIHTMAWYPHPTF